jgi:hypothetical protein
MGRIQPAALDRCAIDVMAADQAKHLLGPTSDNCEQALTCLPEPAHDVIRTDPRQARDHQAAIATRRALPDRRGFQHDDARAGLGQSETGRKPENAGADDGDIGGGTSL